MHLAQLHKKQTLQLPGRKPRPAPEPSSGKLDAPKKHSEQPQPTAGPAKNLLPMKIFFAIIGVGLIFSTFTGLYMSYKIGRNKVLLAALFLAGIVIPVLLTAL